MKPVPLAATTRDLLRVVNQLITYWNQGIDENVLKSAAVKASKLSWPLLAPDGKVSAPSYAFSATVDTDSGWAAWVCEAGAGGCLTSSPASRSPRTTSAIW